MELSHWFKIVIGYLINVDVGVLGQVGGGCAVGSGYTAFDWHVAGGLGALGHCATAR